VATFDGLEALEEGLESEGLESPPPPEQEVKTITANNEARL